MLNNTEIKTRQSGETLEWLAIAYVDGVAVAHVRDDVEELAIERALAAAERKAAR